MNRATYTGGLIVLPAGLRLKNKSPQQSTKQNSSKARPTQTGLYFNLWNARPGAYHYFTWENSELNMSTSENRYNKQIMKIWKIACLCFLENCVQNKKNTRRLLSTYIVSLFKLVESTYEPPEPPESPETPEPSRCGGSRRPPSSDNSSCHR